jgi:hypothetical protein
MTDSEKARVRPQGSSFWLLPSSAPRYLVPLERGVFCEIAGTEPELADPITSQLGSPRWSTAPRRRAARVVAHLTEANCCGRSQVLCRRAIGVNLQAWRGLGAHH